jgi:iron complex outermembrane receptor protein
MSFSIHFKKKLWLLFILIVNSSIINSQKAIINGTVRDGEDLEFLIGVNIQNQDQIGTITDFNGEYSLELPSGEHTLIFKYIGYKTVKKTVSVTNNQQILLDVVLVAENNQLDEMVISANKYEEKLGEVSVSMAIIKPDLIENKATRDAESIIEQVPGVQINENQVSIRGGSGWSYGAGSRVMVMVDGMPMLAGDANDIKWTGIPLENISQIEILKGASSVLYGSSALNGVINIRTKYPKERPITKINISNGFYMSGFGTRKGTSLMGGDSILDQRSDQTWWDQPRGYVQGNICHLNKLNEYNELVVGGSFMKDQGYRFGSDDQRTRINAGWKHFSKKYNGLSYGLNLNNNFNKNTLFFLWAGQDSVLYALGGTNPQSTTMSTSSSSRIIVDPYISLVTKNGKEHHFKTRYYRTNNINNTNQNSLSDFVFGEYQFQEKFKGNATLTSGASGSYTNVVSELYGNHQSSNLAAYVQTNKKWNKMSVTAGMRMEYFKIDSVQSKGKLFNADLNIPFQPVFRFGGTYSPLKYTFLRASYGQGYRFPSIAEKYISSSVGALNVFPNLNIQPEYGWSAEMGLKQGFKIKNFQGYLDISGFITQYNDMMEFIFGIYNLDGSNLSDSDLQNISSQGFEVLLNYIGARSSNVQNANIPGFEVSLVGQGDLTENISFSILAGYTYINPTAINPDSTYLLTFSNPDSIDPNNSILKYRNKHLAKIDFQLDYKKFSVGISTRYTSLMENVDNIFVEPILPGLEILPGYGKYRNSRMNGDVIFDARIAYQMNKKSKVSILMNNVLNREYTNRPGNVMPPRTILWQYSLKF